MPKKNKYAEEFKAELNKIWKNVNSLGDKYNLSKKYPDYFKKGIFRGAVALIILLFILALYSEDWEYKTKMFISCPEIGPACENPLYICNFAPEHENYYDLCEVEFKSLLARDPCPLELCKIQYIQPGETIGERPGGLVANFPLMTFCIIALAFGFNHLLYLRRLKKNGHNTNRAE